MNKHLQEILQETNTIIIPGLGALTITSAKTGDIYFMPFLKHDDGRLAKYISEKEKIDVSEAKKTIIEYVTIVTQALESEKYFEMDHFGKFFINKNSEIEFQKWEDYQQIDKSILAAAKRRKEEEIKKNDEKVHHYIDEHKIESPNPLHLSLDEIQIHPVFEENIDKLSDIETELDNAIVTEEIINIDNIEENETENNENIETIIQYNNEIKLQNIETEIESTKLNDNIQTFNIIDTENTNSIQNEKSLEEILYTSESNINNSSTIDSEAEKPIEKEPINENITDKKKKKGGIIIWILVGLVITSGIIAYNLHQRKGEKIVIKEQIVIKKEEDKQKIEKHITTEIIKEENRKQPEKRIVKEIKRNFKDQKSKEIDLKQTQKAIIDKPDIKSNTKDGKQVTINKPAKENNQKIDESTNISSRKKLENIPVSNVSTMKQTINKENTSSLNTKNNIENKVSTIGSSNSNAKQTINTASREILQNQSTTNTTKKTQTNSIDNKTTTINTNTNKTNSINGIQTNNPTDKQVATTNNSTIVNKQSVNNVNKITAPAITNNTKTSTITQNTSKPNNSIASTGNQNNTNIKQNVIIDNEAVKNSKKNSALENVKTNTPQKINTTTIESNPKGKKIQLIAGTFKDKSSAEKLMNQLKADGYSNTKITEKQGSFEVNIDSYATLSETYKALQKYKNGNK